MSSIVERPRRPRAFRGRRAPHEWRTALDGAKISKSASDFFASSDVSSQARASGAMPAASAGSSGAGDAVRDDRIRFTTRKVPENPSVKERAGLPFGVLVQPHLPSSRDGTDASSRDAIERAVPEVVSAEDVARCTECFGYVNGYCGLERDGWVCILCGTFSYWPHSRGGASSRYRRNPNRKHLPEIARADLDVEVAVEHIVFEPESPVGTAPAYVALIDLTASERTLESVKSAVLAAMEAAGDAALFGVACFDETMTVIDAANPGATSMKRIAVSDDGALALPLRDIMPLEAFLVPVRTHKDRIAAAVEALAPAPRVARTSGTEAASAAAPLGDDARNAPNERLQMRSTMVAEHADDVPVRPSFLSALAGAARARRKPPDPRGGLLDARPPERFGAAGQGARGALASLVAALRGARVRERSELAELAEESEETTRETRERAFGAKRVVGHDRPSRLRGARAFGPALEATLTFLGAEGVDGAETTSPRRGSGFRAGRGVQPSAADAPRHPTCRVMAFLAGAPDLGDGAVAGPVFSHKKPEAPLDDAYASAAAAADDALETVTSFYADAGDRAALAAVAVDVFCFDEPDSLSRDGARAETNAGDERTYLASVAPLASRSGGALFRYGGANAAGDDAAFAPPVPRDVFRALAGERRGAASAGDALHCTLRVRVSAELAVCAARGGGIMPDETYEGLFHVPRCAPGDCFAFDLEHVSARGFGRGGDCPPTVQMAFEFTQIETLFEDARAIGITRRRVRRVCTRQAAVAATPAETHASADAEATFGVLYRKILDAAEEDGVAEARELLADWLAALAAKRARECGAQMAGGGGVDGNTKASFALDASFANEPALRRLARLTHAALARSAAVAVPGFVASCLAEPHPHRALAADARVAAFWTHRRLGPGALARATYPEITAWRADGAFLTSRDDDAAAYASDAASPREGRLNAAEEEAMSKNEPASFPRRSSDRPTIVGASRDALIRSGGSLFVADAHDTIVVFQAPTQPGSPAALAAFPPARGAPARARVERLQTRRAPAPVVSYVRGGAESPAPFDAALVEEMDVALMPGGQIAFGGLRAFERATEARARAMLEGDS